MDREGNVDRGRSSTPVHPHEVITPLKPRLDRVIEDKRDAVSSPEDYSGYHDGPMFGPTSEYSRLEVPEEITVDIETLNDEELRLYVKNQERRICEESDAAMDRAKELYDRLAKLEQDAEERKEAEETAHNRRAMIKELTRKREDLAKLKAANLRRERRVHEAARREEIRQGKKREGFPGDSDGEPDKDWPDKPKKEPKDSKEPDDPFDHHNDDPFFPDDHHDDDPSDDNDSDESYHSDHRRNRRPNQVIHNHNSIKYPAPKNYDGSDKITAENWLFQLDTYFEVTEVPFDKRIPVAILLLAGYALTWWKAQVRDNTEPRTWDGFKNRIKAQFKQINASKKARVLLRQLTQTTSVASYTARFRELTLDIDDMEQSEKFHRYRDGLKPHIREELDKRY